MLKNSPSKELEENRRDCPESNKVPLDIDKKPLIWVETSLTTEDLASVNSSSELKMAILSPSVQKNRHLPVGKKRKSKTPEPSFKAPNKIELRMLSSRRSIAEECIFNTYVPNIDSLKEAHCIKYKERLFDKMLDWRRIIHKLFFWEDESGKVTVLTDDLILQSLKSNNGHERDNNITIIRNFIKGLKLLETEYKEVGIKEIKKAALAKLPHAMFTYAMITFRQVVKCCYSNKDSNSEKSKPPTKTERKNAVRYMLDVKQRFFPLPNFVLGMIQLYNIDLLAKVIEKESNMSDPWSDYLEDVFITGISEEGGEISDEWLNILNSVEQRWFPRFYNNRFLFPLKHTHILQDQNGDYHKWMCNVIKYELAKSSILERKNLTIAKDLLKNLCSENFVDAEYFYASSLLTNAFCDVQLLHNKNLNEALDLLNRAVLREHHEAMLLCGTMPFRKEFDNIVEENRKQIGKECFLCLVSYVRCGEDFRKEAAVLVAAEFLKKGSSYAYYDEENAKEILATNDCSKELLALNKYQQARKDMNNAIHDVLKALEEVNLKLEIIGGVYSARLLSILHPLFDTLQGLEIRKSKKLTLLLQIVHLECTDLETSTMERRLLSSIHFMFEMIQNKLEAPCSSVKQKLSSLIGDLFKTYFAIKMESTSIPTEANKGRSFGSSSVMNCT